MGRRNQKAEKIKQEREQKQADREYKRKERKKQEKMDELKYLNEMREFRVQVQKMGLKIVEMGEDGNCLFRALSDQLHGHQNDHKSLRAKAINYLRENKETFKFYIEDDQTFDDYIADMSKDGFWGGQLEMTALAEILNFNVVVHQVNAPIMAQTFHPPMGSVPTLHLSYHLGQHYNSLRKESDPCSGPALDFPIGHQLDMAVLQGEEETGGGKLEDEDPIQFAMNLFKKQDRELMVNALKEVFGDLASLTAENVMQLSDCIGEKYEELSLQQNFADLSINSTKEETKDEPGLLSQAEIYDKLKQNKELILNSKGQVAQPPAPNKKCPCNSKKNYKKCACAHADLLRTKEFVQAHEDAKKGGGGSSAQKGTTTFICV